MSHFLGSSTRPVTIGQLVAFGMSLDIVQTERGGRPHLQCFSTKSGSPFGTLSAHIPEVTLAAGEHLIRMHGENRPLRERLLSSGYFADTGKRVNDADIELEVWKQMTPPPLTLTDGYFPPCTAPAPPASTPTAKPAVKRAAKR